MSQPQPPYLLSKYNQDWIISEVHAINFKIVTWQLVAKKLEPRNVSSKKFEKLKFYCLKCTPFCCYPQYKHSSVHQNIANMTSVYAIGWKSNKTGRCGMLVAAAETKLITFVFFSFYLCCRNSSCVFYLPTTISTLFFMHSQLYEVPKKKKPKKRTRATYNNCIFPLFHLLASVYAL